MRPPKPKFPHISRFFSAGLPWVSLITVLFLNITLRASVDPGHTNAIIGILSHPGAPEPHVSFAQLLKQEDRLIPAAQELRIAAELAARRGASANILGVTTDPLSLLEAWQREQERQVAAYRFWRTVAEDKPDYRDAHLLAASLAFQQEDFSEAERFAQATLRLDPNNREAQQLLETLDQ